MNPPPLSSPPLNPYAAPVQMPGLVPGSSQLAYFRDGKFLVVRDGVELPVVCLRTNQAVNEGDWRKRMTIVWSPPWVLALILVNIIVLIIVALIVQKKAKITYSLGREARGRINRKRLIGFLLLLSSAAPIAVAVNLPDTSNFIWFFIGSIVLVIASVVMFVVANPIKASGHINGWFKVKGCSPDFLDTLPNNPGVF